MIGPEPKCLQCEHFNGKLFNWNCKAFPKGIPDEIISKGFDHRKEFPGDNGIRFKQKQE
jgi:hypothetical protein